jgi:hypothetical protein
MAFDFSDILEALQDNVFEETPVGIEEFINGEKYLNRPEITLSDHQRICILALTQIYKKETLYSYMHPDEAEKRWTQTMNEIILQLGKGSGKDFMSALACCYVIYLLLCLKDPARYYNKPSGDSIDIINIAINAAQASNVFFANVSRLIKAAPWFAGRYDAKPGGDPQKNNEFNFDKNINLYSGHSEREAWEGYNVIMVILDEISGFALESTSGNAQSKTAQAVYDMYRASVDSRFPDFGKLALLSFPRFKNDFIQQRYAAVIQSMDTVMRSYVIKKDPDLPDGIEENEFTVEWTEDRNLVYNFPRVFALRRPTWEVNPARKIEDFAIQFYTNRLDALSRFACMPPDAIDAFFKDRQKIEHAFFRANGLDNDTGKFKDNFLPDKSKTYFVHVDLARKHDHCAVAMAHVAKWEKMEFAGKMTEPAPIVVVDAIRWWTPTKDKNVDFTDVREYIVSLQKRGFNLRLVTFDRWESDDMMKYLNGVGIRSERLSVAKKHYTDMAGVVHDERLAGPNEQLLIDELLELRIMPNDKVDHPRKGSKDLADATCGAIYNAISHTSRNMDQEVEIKTYEQMRREAREEVREGLKNKFGDRNVIVAPNDSGRSANDQYTDVTKMPKELSEYLANIQTV